MMSSTRQFNRVQRASMVLVETESPAFMRLMVELLTPPLFWSVYVVAPSRFIVRHSGS